MGLKLTGKGSILDAIGGALNTGANAVVAGVKDVGDLGSLGVAKLTGNTQAAQNASEAISSNDNNLSGQAAIPRVFGDLEQPVIGTADSIINPVKGLLNTDNTPLATGVKIAAADLSGNKQARANALANYYKGGKGKINLKEIAFAGAPDNVGELPGGAHVGPEGLPTSKPTPERAPINDKPVPAPKTVAGPDDVLPLAPEQALANVHAQNPLATPEPAVEPTPPEPSPEELQAATDNVNADMHDPGIDWTKVSGAGDAVNQAIQNRAETLKSMDTGARGGLMIDTTGFHDAYSSGLKRISEHSKFYRDYFKEHGHAPRNADWLEEAHSQLETGKDQESLDYQALKRHAQAEQHYNDFQKADQGSGYNKAKWQLPKGAPAKRFIQALYDKTHSPEYVARNNIGARLGDVRNTLKGVKLLRDRAQKELDTLTKRGSNASESSIREKAAEVRSHNTRYNVLKAQETHHALSYKTLATALDEKYPDVNLKAKPGTRLSTDARTFETARPVKPPAETVAAGEPIAPSGPNFTPSESTPYTGPNLNEGAFSPEDRAQLEAANAKQEAEFALPRDANGDTAILDGIKNGDSDAAIVKAYMDATGSSLEEAKKAYGLIEDNPHADTAGAVENNPYHGKIANYDIGKAPEPGKILSRTKGAARNLINKSLLRATAYGDHLAFKLQDASHLWSKLDSEDKTLADSLRDHSIEGVAAKAKNPEAFTAYATRAKDIEDYIHAARGIADPADVTPYRQRYGAGFHLQDENGKPISISPYKEGQTHAFQEARHYNNYEDIEAQTGLKRSSQDFHEDLTKDVVSAQRHTAVNSLYEGLKQAFGPDAVSGTRTTEATTPLKEFDGLYARKDIADRINSRARYEYRDDKLGSLLKGYDTVNSSMKNIKLSMGGFHNINIMLNQAALNPSGVGAAGKALVSDDAFREQMNKWDADGTMEKALHTGLTMGGGNEFDSAVNKVPVIKQFHDALFKRQIPFSKMQVFDRYTHDLSLNNPADYDKMRGVARGINNTFGGINRLVDGMSPERMKQFSRGILAVDYNEGQIRTLLTAFDPSKIGTIEGRMARQVVVGRASILAAPGTAQAIANGQIGSNPDQVAKFIAQQYVNPTVSTPWKTAGGTPKRVSLIAGVVNKVDRAITPALNKNNPNKASGIEQEAAGNLSPGASFAEEEKTNSDYYGNKVRTGNIAQDVGAAVNAAAPIPASPIARGVEGTRFGKNGVVKTLAGGQSAISPEEAITDISGVGRVSADPNSPQMKILNSRQLVAEGLKTTQDKAALQAVHPSWDGSLSKTQQQAIYSSPQYEINKWNVLRQNQNVYDALKKQDSVEQANGQPGNPLFAMPKQDYNVLTEYEFLKHADEGPDANNTAAVIYSQNKAMIDKYEQNNQGYQSQLNSIYNKTNGLQGDNAPVEKVGGAPSYTPTPQQTNLSNKYFAMNDSNSTSSQRAQFLTDNPQLVQLFNVQFQAENLIRKQQNEPLLKPFPEAPAALNTWMNNYTAADKATRTSLRTANPDEYNAMSNYFAQVDEYDLAKTAGQAQFQGQQFSQGNLKEIYNLGQYDIAKKPGADGGDTYVVDPQAAYAAKTSAGASGSGGSSGTLSTSKRRDIKLSVKYAYKPVRTRIHGQKKLKYTRPRIAVAPRSKTSLKAKTTTVA